MRKRLAVALAQFSPFGSTFDTPARLAQLMDEGTMLPLSQWPKQSDWLARPWLMVGKGPSSALLDRLDLRPYIRMSLNHAVRELKVDVPHFIDLEALEATADAVRNTADWLLITKYPHRNFAPVSKPLEELLDEVPVLREFSRRGRLVWY